MRRHPTSVSFAIALVLTFLVTLAAPAASSHHKFKSTAWLFGPTTMKGWAKFDQKKHGHNAQQRLRIKVEQGVPHQAFDVAINGVIVGTLTTNSGGTGRLTLNNPDLPEGFPCLDTGTVVTVGELSGVFFDCGDHGVQKFRTKGSVETPEGIDIEVKYCERFKHGNLNRRFQVEIEDAAPGQVFDVSVNGEVVGSVTAGDDGEAELQLRTNANGDDDEDDEVILPMPDTFPSLHDGDVVVVGGVDVTLGVQAGGDDDDDQNGQGDDDNEGDD